MEVIPNKAPQKAYILQPVEEKKEESISFILKLQFYHIHIAMGIGLVSEFRSTEVRD